MDHRPMYKAKLWNSYKLTIGENLDDHRFDNFLDTTPKTWYIREKN